MFFRFPPYWYTIYKILMHNCLKVGRFQKKHPLPISKDTEKKWKLQFFFGIFDFGGVKKRLLAG